MKKHFLLLFVCTACASVPVEGERAVSSALFTSYPNGVEMAQPDRDLVVIRADPILTPLELVNQNPALSLAQTGKLKGFIVAINAAMFAKDYVTSIGYMKNFETVNNPRFNPKLRSFLLFHPKNKRSPAVKIGTKEDLDAYHTAFQTHRMIDGSGKILWNRGASVYHQVGLVGVDGKNRVLFFFHPALIDMHDLVEKILELKLDLRGLLYLDGGNHGSLYLSPDLGGGWNTWIPLPNVLGIASKKKANSAPSAP